MEATHFVEIVKHSDGKYGQSSLSPIQELKHCLSLSEFCNWETIAVWRIKQTDIPLHRRISERLISNYRKKYGFLYPTSEMLKREMIKEQSGQ